MIFYGERYWIFFKYDFDYVNIDIIIISYVFSREDNVCNWVVEVNWFGDGIKFLFELVVFD